MDGAPGSWREDLSEGEKREEERIKREKERREDKLQALRDRKSLLSAREQDVLDRPAKVTTARISKEDKLIEKSKQKLDILAKKAGIGKKRYFGSLTQNLHTATEKDSSKALKTVKKLIVQKNPELTPEQVDALFVYDKVWSDFGSPDPRSLVRDKTLANIRRVIPSTAFLTPRENAVFDTTFSQYQTLIGKDEKSDGK